MGKQPLVYVIILNWERPEDTLRCIDSVQRSTYSSFRIVVVDNGSTDGSPERIAQHSQEVLLLRNRGNLGYAEGTNVGLRYALESAADYMLILNNDMAIAPDAIEHLVALGEAQPRIGAAGGKVYWEEAPERLWAAGPAFPPGQLPLDQGQYDQVREVLYVAGCFLLVRRAAVEKVGLLDADFFLLCEEIDWCMRMSAADYRVVYLPTAKAWHRGAASFGGVETAAYRYYATRNWLLLLEKRGYLSRRPRSLMIIAREAFIQARLVLGYRRAGTLHRLRAIAQGIVDFLRGRVGEGPAWLVEKTPLERTRGQ